MQKLCLHFAFRVCSPHPVTASCVTAANLDDDGGFKEPTDHQSKELFLPFRCFCTRKDVSAGLLFAVRVAVVCQSLWFQTRWSQQVRCKDVLLEDVDAAKAIVEFVSHAAIEKLVVGASSKGGFVRCLHISTAFCVRSENCALELASDGVLLSLRRFKNHDVAASITKGVPDFCTVYVIGKGKVSAMRSAVRPAPAVSPLRAQIQSEASLKPDALPTRFLLGPKGASCLLLFHFSFLLLLGTWLKRMADACRARRDGTGDTQHEA
ncbi:hypothetical protein B296_00000465 [Ensete ventricosum]|uniref:RING-type E3 ubiquitin transferase n=1 Tax=Ensete ventricosum TaxID=4639 RepID=A0A427A2D7_ENSVE|nr:hypothetical protein B296_00000465 [Ensete ventricosum]